MTISIEELYDRALALSSDVEDKFLELGRALRQLLDRDPALFQQVVKKRGLGRRKAYYLVEVSRKFEPLPISRARLKKIGWTKLQIIGQHVTKDNVEELVNLAEQLKTKQLERKMQGDDLLEQRSLRAHVLQPGAVRGVRRSPTQERGGAIRARHCRQRRGIDQCPAQGRAGTGGSPDVQREAGSWAVG